MNLVPFHQRVVLLFICVLPFVFAPAAGANIPASERAVLLNFYASTNGAGWTNKSGWNGAAGTECAWFGIVCGNGATTVTGIMLNGNNLVGTLPSDLNNLPNLFQFNVNANSLGGPIPQLTGLTNLWAFEVAQN